MGEIPLIMKVKLPDIHRPRNVWYKRCALGIDLSASFVHNLWSLDENLFPVWHQYEILWDEITNQYSEGRIIEYRYGHLNFGFVPKNKDGSPKEDPNSPTGTGWHIWELCPDRGWGHVCKLESTDGEYLKLVLNRLYTKTRHDNKYGRVGSQSYQKLLDQLNEEQREREQEELRERMDAINEENAWLAKRAMDNFERGNTKPTNPQHETIISYPGQGNRSRIIRPLQDEDRESGIIIPH
jgi:hypothetical protein